MAKVTIIGKDWGFFATSLAEDLTRRHIRVVRRFAPNELLSEPSQPISQKILNYSKHLFRRINKPLWVYKASRKFAELAELIWWLTGIRGSNVVVVSSVPSVLQTKIFIGLCRGLRKQVVLCIHGTDARPPFLNGLFFEEVRAIKGADFVKFVGKFRKKVLIASAKSTAVISWLGSAHYLSGQCFLFEEIGFPVRPTPVASDLQDASEPQSPDGQSQVFRIVHAPSSSGKGSPEIRQIIEDLILAGYPLHLTELVNQSNREVLKEVAKSDLVIDQIYSDNFSGVLAREAAGCSRWVVVGGNSLNVMKNTSWELPPVMVSSAKNLRKDIVWCFENRDILPRKAERLRSHFRKKNFTDFFVDAFITSAFGEDSQARFRLRKPFTDFHPGFGGYGQDLKLREMTHKIVQTTGIPGLHLPKAFAEALLARLEIELTESLKSASAPHTKGSG